MAGPLQGRPRSRTSRVAVILGVALLGLHVLTFAQQQKPVFRTRIDLMQLDVTVLDRKGQPVRGLTKDDFTLLEDNAQQTIQGFTAIDLPEREVAGPPWADAVPRDVATNDIDGARLFVLVLDDAFGMGPNNKVVKYPNYPAIPDAGAIKTMRVAAQTFIETLGPRDLAGVTFTGTTGKYSQNLTSDKAKLSKALQAYPADDGNLIMDKRGLPLRPETQSQCLAAKETLRLMEAVVMQLASMPDRRKSVLYFGGSMPWAADSGADPCGTYWLWRDVFVAAQQGSVTINPIQTSGLLVPPRDYDKYLSVADYTCGHAVINTNDLKPGIRRIFLESSSYYLIAYQPTKGLEDGTFRKITVKVNRPDVEVITKRNYWAPRPPDTKEAAPAEPSPQIKALSGLLPDSKLKLRATAVPFPIAGTDRAVIALAVGITQPAFAGRTPEQVELLIRSFTTTGDPKAGDTQTIPLTVPAPREDQATSQYEVLARIEVAKPGPYHLRLSAHSTASDTRGSVFVDVDVPDFRRDRLSLSGAVINALPAAGPTAPPRLLSDLAPLPPTTLRVFSANDLVTTFVRVYQNAEAPTPVAMTIRIQDGGGARVVDAKDTIAPAQFGADRGATYQYRIPFTSLTGSGLRDYLLTFEASVGRTIVRRDVAFQVR